MQAPKDPSFLISALSSCSLISRGPHPLQVFSLPVSEQHFQEHSVWVTVSKSPEALTRSTDSFALVRDSRESSSLCPAAAALCTERLFIWQASVHCANPRLPCQVLALSPGCYQAKHAAGTERVTASLIYLPQIKQTLTPALNLGWYFTEGQKGSISAEGPSVCFAWDIWGTLHDSWGLQEATLENKCQVLKRLNVGSPHDLAVPLPGMYPRGIKARVHVVASQQKVEAAQVSIS